MRFSRVLQRFFAFGGGLDTETSPVALEPGYLRSSSNYECGVVSGYSRIAGYERYDGHPEPHKQNYYTLPVTITGAYATGNVITGVNSGFTAVIEAGDANAFYITKATGAFVVGETLNISGTPRATVLLSQYEGGAPSTLLNLEYKSLAANRYRADILAVPGQGPIRGVAYLDGVLYAWRDRVGGARCDIQKQTANGWLAIYPKGEVNFTAGTGIITEGATLTQGANTGTIVRVVIESGTLLAGTAAGRLIIASGTFSAGVATASSGGSVTVTNTTVPAILPGGRYKFVTYGFAGSRRLYGCDGVNRAFEFDGGTYVAINTKMSPDIPQYIAAHKAHLLASFGRLLQFSSIGAPYQWSPITGAGEFGVGDDITGLSSIEGDQSTATLIVASRNSLNMLYGSSSADFRMVLYQQDTGCIAHTLQLIGTAYMLDDRGILQLGTSAAFGNFEHSTLSRRFRTLINQLRPSAVDSLTVREKNQYRLLFAGGKALYITVNGSKITGATEVTYAHNMVCSCAAEDSSGNEVIFYGADNGFVYRSDVGTSFDGDPIPFGLSLAYNHLGSPGVMKTMKMISIEVDSTESVFASIGFALGYQRQEVSQPAAVNLSITTSAGVTWDSGLFWDSGLAFDGTPLAPWRIPISGTAENISLAVNGSSSIYPPHTFYGAIIDYIPRNLKK